MIQRKSLTLRRAARRAIPLVQGLLLATVASGPLLADDTEVFLSALSVNEASKLKPNVLFVLDTSV